MQRPSSMPPVLSGYEYVRLLGSGGFSDVFLYDQAFPKRRVAVKVLLLEDLTQASRDSFTAEANVMAQLSAHPYIVTIFQAAVSEDDRPYLVMEYCSGPSLAEQYKKQPLTVAQTLEMGVRLSSAIATAHAAGILHRDIKPANVLTNQFGWPALTDFGISSTVDEFAPTMTTTSRALANSTATGAGTASVGMSIPWSPPEMFDDDPQPDVRSDVFSLAATLYTVLAGHTPFEVPGRSNGSVDLIGRIARGAVTPMSRADVPASLNAVLQKGMASDPKDRFATAVEFGRALQRVEVELAYVQTPLDIPNLPIDRPEHAGAGDESSADETRARVIPTIRAQAVLPPTAQTPTPSLPIAPIAVPAETVVRKPSSTVEHTQLRRPTAVDSATVLRSPTAPPETPAATEGLPRRRGLRLSIIGAIVIVAVVIVAAAFLATMAKPTAKLLSKSATAGTSSVPAGEDAGVPTPGKPVGQLVSGGTSVQFTWVNPTPQKGDSYTWATDNAGGPGQTTQVSSPQATVPYSGSTTCITVSIIREGAQSTLVTGCYPK